MAVSTSTVQVRKTVTRQRAPWEIKNNSLSDNGILKKNQKQSKEIKMRGGKRSGAGRRKGAPNKATAERQAAIAASGEAPLDYNDPGHAGRKRVG
jgi:hypothetical protein